MSNDDRNAVASRILADPELLSGNPELAYLLINLAHLLDIHITHGNGENFAEKARVSANALRRVNVGDRQGVENVVAEPSPRNPRVDAETEAETWQGLAQPGMTVVLRDDRHPNIIKSLETSECRLEVHASCLPILQTCYRLTIIAETFDAPELTTCDRIVNYANTLTLPKLKDCDFFADVKAAALHLPSLEKVNLFSTHKAKTISLPRLKTYRSFWVYHGTPSIDIGSRIHELT